jgi:hypothetical protein
MFEDKVGGIVDLISVMKTTSASLLLLSFLRFRCHLLSGIRGLPTSVAKFSFFFGYLELGRIRVPG